MRWRLLGGALVLALLGGAGGFAYATTLDHPVTAIDEVSPVPASDPSLPVPEVAPDPDDPALATGLFYEPERLEVLDERGRPRYVLRLPVPRGWERVYREPASWNYTRRGNDPNSYGFTVDILAGTGLTVEQARKSREAALSSAAAQGALPDMEIRPQDEDTFLARFIKDGYRRLSLERFYGGPDPDQAYASVRVYGRDQDLTGMTDLLALISRDLRTGQSP